MKVEMAPLHGPRQFPLGPSSRTTTFGRAALYVSGIHGSLQNLPQVVAQVSYVLLEPKFEAYRPSSEALSLRLDDAYLVGEPVKIRCDAGMMAPEALLIVEDAATVKQLFKRNVVPQSNEPFRWSTCRWARIGPHSRLDAKAYLRRVLGIASILYAAASCRAGCRERFARERRILRAHPRVRFCTSGSSSVFPPTS